MKQLLLVLLFINFATADILSETLLDMKGGKDSLGNKTIYYYTDKKEKVRRVEVKKPLSISKTYYSYKNEQIIKESTTTYKVTNGKKRPISIKTTRYYDNEKKDKSKRLEFVFLRNSKIRKKTYYREDGTPQSKGIYYFITKNKKRVTTKRIVIDYYKDGSMHEKIIEDYKNNTKQFIQYYKGKNLVAADTTYSSKTDYSIDKRYTRGGELRLVTITNKDTKITSSYNNGKLSHQSTFKEHQKYIEHILDISFTSKGHKIIEKYQNSKRVFNMVCEKDVSAIITKLDSKYKNRVKNYKRIITKCFNLDDNTTALALYYKQNSNYKKGLFIVAQSEKNSTSKSKTDYILKGMDFRNPIWFDIEKHSYRAVRDKKVLDIVGEDDSSGKLFYRTFYFRENKILELKRPTFSFKTINLELRAMGKPTKKTIRSLLYEVPIENKSKKEYKKIAKTLKDLDNNLSAYLQDKIEHSELPKISKYKINYRYKEPNAKLVEKGFGKMYRTRLKQALASKKPNFAGRYIVTIWGCDEGKNGCITGGIVDAKTGIATPFPLKLYNNSKEEQEILYKLSNSLITFEGNIKLKDGKKYKNRALIYNVSRGKFKLLSSVKSSVLSK